MAIEAAMDLTNRLLAQAQALGAVIALMRASTEDVALDAPLRQRCERIVDLLGARQALEDLEDGERAVVVAFARSYMRQAVELMDDPGRPSSWTHSDPTILQAQGAASAIVASLLDRAGLAAPGTRFLDIGTGVAGLAIALCNTFPGSTVVGLDPWEPSLAIARRNVAEAGLDDRITLHAVRVEDYTESEPFDLVWLPSFFIPEAVIDDVMRRVAEVLRPGGRIVVGVVESTDDPLAGAVDAMITVRSGGSVLESGEAARRLEEAGFVGVGEAERTWRAPLRLVVGQKGP